MTADFEGYSWALAFGRLHRLPTDLVGTRTPCGLAITKKPLDQWNAESEHDRRGTAVCERCDRVALRPAGGTTTVG